MTPRTASVPNQTTITGPNSLPMVAVPCCCMTNKPTRMTSASGTIKGCKTSVATSRPSIAESTEIAGVIRLSPKNREAPSKPRIINALYVLEARGTCDWVSASSARMPPSPLLSARIMTLTYFKDTTSISDQKISDRMPRMFAWTSGRWCAVNTSFTA